MSIYTKRVAQKIPASVEDVWDYISTPRNLKKITPDYMGFDIKTDLPEKMYEGMFIQYIVTPVLGIPMTWLTEITHIKEQTYFVDEQRSGPYTIWHHQHHLKEIEGGVLMTDIIDYKPPLGFIGDIANVLFIKRKLTEIFDYRFIAIEKTFGIWES